ncbi:MAG: hypothetical protein ACRY3E_00120, partial [Candidatus Lariskella arthropodorum]
SVAAILYAYGSTQRAYSLQTAAQQVQQLGAAENAYMMEQGVSSTIDAGTLYSKGYIDYNYGTTGDNQVKSAFGTAINVIDDPAGPDSAFFVSMDTGSDKNCSRMASEWNNAQSGTKAYCDANTGPAKDFPATSTGNIVHILFNPSSFAGKITP